MTIDEIIIICTVVNPPAENEQFFTVDQTAVEQAGKRVHVRRGQVVSSGQVQSCRAGKDGAGVRDSGTRHHSRRYFGLMRRCRFRLAIYHRARLRTGTRPVRDDTARRRQNTREIRGRLFWTVSTRKLPTYGCLTNR